MKKDLAELIIVLDESGSMADVVSDTIGGYNTFIETHQALPGEAKLTLVKFDTKYDIVHNGVDIKDVPKLDNKTYVPGSMTALLDAVGRTIDEVGKRLDATPEDEKPGKVIMMIITDGEENSSKEYTLQQVKEKMKHQQDTYQWEVIFLGADQDAWSNAQSMGVNNSRGFAKQDMNKTIKGMAYYSSNSRVFASSGAQGPSGSSGVSGQMADFDLSEEDLDAQLEKLKKK